MKIKKIIKIVAIGGLLTSCNPNDKYKESSNKKSIKLAT